MSSFNTLYSCDVIQNGDDSSPAGPFLTINAAITYMKNNFSSYLASGQHGTINIGPGTWNETISLTTTDATNFIDFVGAGIDDTIIENTTNGFININALPAENHFSNMTINYTGASTLGNCAVYVSANSNVWFRNCQITSTQACVGNLEGGTIDHCQLISTALNAETVVNNVGSVSYVGRVQYSSLTANGLASGGIGFQGGSAGIVEYCDVILNGAAATHGIVGITNFSAYRCNFSIGGYIQVDGGSISYLRVQSTCVSTAALLLLGGSLVDHCYFNNSSSSQSTITSGGSGGTITNSTFLQLSNSVSVYSSAGNVTKIFDTVMLNNGGGGYCIAAISVGADLTIANLISNCPIDPGFTLTDAGLTGTSIGLAKGYNQKRWFSINCSGGNIYGNGCVATALSTITSGNSTVNGPGSTMNSTSTSSAIYTGSSFADVRLGNSPSLYVKFQMNQTTNTALWCGFFNTALPGNVTTLAHDGAALRYVAGTDTDWQYVTNASGTQTATSSGHAADTNVHTLKIILDYVNSRVLFQLDSNSAVALTTNLPAAGSDLGFGIVVTSQNGSSQTATLFDSWCEYNA